MGSQACFVAVVSPGGTTSDLWGFGCMQDNCCWVSMLCLCPVVGSYCLLLYFADCYSDVLEAIVGSPAV